MEIRSGDDLDGFSHVVVALTPREAAIELCMQSGGVPIGAAMMLVYGLHWVIPVLMSAPLIPLDVRVYRRYRAGIVSYGALGLRSGRDTVPWSDVQAVRVHLGFGRRELVADLRGRTRWGRARRLLLLSPIRQRNSDEIDRFVEDVERYRNERDIGDGRRARKRI